MAKRNIFRNLIDVYSKPSLFFVDIKKEPFWKTFLYYFIFGGVIRILIMLLFSEFALPFSEMFPEIQNPTKGVYIAGIAALFFLPLIFVLISPSPSIL